MQIISTLSEIRGDGDGAAGQGACPRRGLLADPRGRQDAGGAEGRSGEGERTGGKLLHDLGPPRIASTLWIRRLAAAADGVHASEVPSQPRILSPVIRSAALGA